ncbi:MAG: peptidase S8, partial [Dermatophilaceae bacterium]|nr:peptidase S8 [Dermatophilaceae bacterium]
MRSNPSRRLRLGAVTLATATALTSATVAAASPAPQVGSGSAVGALPGAASTKAPLSSWLSAHWS